MIDIKAQINTFPYSWYFFQRETAGKMLIIREEGEQIEEDAFPGLLLITYTDGSMEISDSGFDIVISLISPEKTEDPIYYIQKCYGLLNERGSLFFQMNNRIGIRYFCGDRDPYTGCVFDGIENYYRMASSIQERCYSKTEIKELLKEAGIHTFKLFGVFSGSDYPTHLIAENYVPQEDLANRILPVYHYPLTVFLEEERLYDTLKKENLIHTMANSFLVHICKKKEDISDALYVTLSIGRTRENAYATIIKDDGSVTKKALFEEGKDGLTNVVRNHENLEKRNINVVKVSKISGMDGCVSMPYIDSLTAQKHLQDTLITDKERFLVEMDAFMSEIEKASDVISEDPILGPIGDEVYPDMVPVNAFRTDEGYLFFDQEFTLKDYPINVVKARVLFSFFAYHDELRYVEKELFIRYGLQEQKIRYMEMEWSFLEKLWSEDVLKSFRDNIRRDTPVTDRNRTYINYPAGYYETRYFEIFKGAEDKQCYVFGSGKYAMHFIEQYGKYFPITCVLDNDRSRWGKSINGIEIASPDVLKEVERDSVRVFICVKDYENISRQLDEMRVLDYSVYDKNKVYPRSTGIMPVNRKKYHIGYCAGAFDMFHVGHLNLLQRAKQMCDYLIVGVISDRRIHDLKNKYPVISCEDRVRVVENCRYVDRAEVIHADRAGIMDAYNRFHFDCMFSGDDHAEDPFWLAERDALRKLGSDIVFVSYTDGISSTALRKQISGENDSQ